MTDLSILETPPTILKENVILEESEAETEMSSLAYDVSTSSPPTSGLVAASALPTSAPTLLRDFDPILDELKAESDSEVCIFTTVSVLF